MATDSGWRHVYRGRRAERPVAATAEPAPSVCFDAKPGKLALRMHVEGDGTGALDTEDREITVPDLDGAGTEA